MPRTPDQITAAMAALVREHEPQEARDQQLAELADELAEALAATPTLEQQIAAIEVQTREAKRVRDALAGLDDESLAKVKAGEVTIAEVAGSNE